MKKIGKISINPEKVIKNEELVKLTGGYECEYCYCYDEEDILLGPPILLTGSAEGCWDACLDLYPSTFYGHRCDI
jgi:hypothetical protein